MQYFTPAGSELNASRLAHGCMRLGGKSDAEADRILKAVLDQGINFFDHADIYGRGACEERFGAFLKHNPSLRQGMIIQTKCGIKKGSYDFSPEYIRKCLEGSLSRLGVEQVDVLLLHRPDTLCDPEAVADVFDQLHSEGKVKYFGVSNHTPYQLELLQKYCKGKLLFNQLQIGPAHTLMLDMGLNMNTKGRKAIDRDGMVLDYCRLKEITVQPWSPFMRIRNRSLAFKLRYAPLNRKIRQLAEQYGVTQSAIVIAWLLRHPAGMQPIIGSMNADRIREMSKATEIMLTHDEWYQIYTAANGRLR